MSRMMTLSRAVQDDTAELGNLCRGYGQVYAGSCTDWTEGERKGGRERESKDRKKEDIGSADYMTH